MAISETELAALGIDTSWLPHINEVVEKYKLSTPRRLAMWIAQCSHESQGFKRLTENLSYSANALHRTWPARFHTLAEAREYERQPERIANKVYGGRMGNGPEASGDGWRYRGRGLIQLTGRASYSACGEALQVDLLFTPDLLTTKQFAALSAGWFWSTRKLNALSDTGDVTGVTRTINGGTNGLEERRALYQKALTVLEKPNAEG